MAYLNSAIRGAVAGAVGTWLMDVVTQKVLEHQPAQVATREEQVRPNDRSSVGNLVARIESLVGVRLDERQRSAVEQLVHFGLGVAPGVAYAALRHRLRPLGAANGLVYGILLWALNDEYLNSRLGLSAPFAAYPLESHVRGFVGHVTLGVATDVGLDLLGG
jgi:hypothetical protein